MTLHDNVSDLWTRLREKLEALGIDLEQLGDVSGIKVVCVADDLKDSLREMGKAQRDQVLMVRVDESTMKALDAWVETGAVKSRSEAAALFLREGLKVRSAELDELRDVLEEVNEAKQRLRQKAREVFGEGEE